MLALAAGWSGYSEVLMSYSMVALPCPHRLVSRISISAFRCVLSGHAHAATIYIIAHYMHQAI
jgi:hypothetical protein